MRKLTGDTVTSFADFLEEVYGLAFAAHRRPVLERAIQQCLQTSGVNNPREYLAMVHGDPAERARLAGAATNSLSRFFRNSSQLTRLAAAAYPGLGNGVTAWVAACASGEEPYTLAIHMRRHLRSNTEIRIIATDVSTSALERARRGSYSVSRLTEIPQAYRDPYFTCDSKNLQVRHELRVAVEFREHNLLDPPPVKGADLVLCRNAITYLSERATRVAIRNLAAALAPCGWLATGISETIPDGCGFKLTDARTRLYRRSCK